MNNYECLAKIQNKETLVDILNHSIDHLICKTDDKHTKHNCSKYGFENAEDFLTICRFLATVVRHKINSEQCDGNTEWEEKEKLIKVVPDMKELLPAVLDIRRNEIMNFMLRLKNSMDYPLVESFDWHTTLVKSKYTFQSDRLLTVVIFQTRVKGKNELEQVFFQMDLKMLENFMDVIKEALGST